MDRTIVIQIFTLQLPLHGCAAMLAIAQLNTIDQLLGPEGIFDPLLDACSSP